MSHAGYMVYTDLHRFKFNPYHFTVVNKVFIKLQDKFKLQDTAQPTLTEWEPNASSNNVKLWAEVSTELFVSNLAE